MAVSIEQLKERARDWLEPVSAAAPAGKLAKTEPAYESVLAEVAKLESPSGGEVDWSAITSLSGRILQSSSKDLRIATYLAYGMYVTQGLDGLATGLVVLSETMDRYWPTLFPELNRLRGRVNVLTWLLERAATALPTLEVTAADRERVDALQLAASRLAEVSRQKFESQAPAMRPLLEGIQRLKASLPEEAPPPPAPAPPAAPVAKAAPPPAVEKPAPQVAAPPPPPPVPSAAPAMPAAPAATLASAEAGVDYLRQMGTSLTSAAGVLRRANPGDPVAYRLLRVGLYLHLSQPPPADAHGKTSVPALPAALRTQLERMAGNAKWAEVLEESESALVLHRFCLDLHFHSARALAELGPSFRPARQALLAELSTLLKRMPTWTELVYGDGTPFASAQTKAWLESELAPPAPAMSMGGGTAAAPAPSEGQGSLSAAVTEARALLGSGNAPAAISLLQARVGTASHGRERFQARLAVARLCAAAGQAAVARAIYDALDREAVAHGLDAWEPALVAECLEGVLSCTRPAPKAPESLAVEFANRYHRLCLIDPTAALRVSL
jgi:type VI secretion system protein VasJ